MWFFLIALLVLVQLTWLAFQLLAFPKERKHHDYFEGVSICIASNNELQNLQKLIPALKEQEYKGEWEVIVVLDRSLDASVQYLKEAQENFVKLVLIEQDSDSIPQGESPKKHALLKAINQSKNPLILQTDADCLPASDDWISEMVRSARDSNFVIGLSPYEFQGSLLNQVIQFDTSWTSSSMIAMAEKNMPYMSLGRNQLFRKDYFEEKGGYGKAISLTYGDDDLLLQNLNPKKSCKTCVTKGSQTVSIPETRWSDWLGQKLRHTLAGKHYKSNFLRLLSLNYLSGLFWVFWIFLLVLSPEQKEIAVWIFLIRSLLFSVLFYLLAKRTESVVKWWLIPLLDLIHSTVLYFNGIRALFTTKVRWR